MSEEDEFEKLIRSLKEGADKEEAIPGDQRSHRRRLDRLLQSITERPGQLRFNGSALGVLQGSPEGENQFSVGIGSFDIYASTAFGPNSARSGMFFTSLPVKLIYRITLT